jgi:TRAP-type C4-dicarboxylate transport system substrate-binding protein
MKSKKTFTIIVAILAVISIVAIISSESAAGTKKHVLKVAQTIYPAPSAHMDSIDRIVKKVKEKTNGRITFKVYGPELADWAELNEMVMRGDIDMMLSPMSPSYDPRWNTNAAPYIVTSYEEAKKAFGPGGFMNELFTTWAKDSNLLWLGTWVQGFGGASMNKRAALTPEEAKGIKIRVPGIAIMECYYDKLGFTPALIPYSEVPTSIGTGIVDGQAGGGPFQAYTCCRDLNKFFVFYRDIVEVWGYNFNTEKWNELEADDQKIIQDVVKEEALMRVDAAEKEDSEYLQKLKDHGLTVVDLADHPEKLKMAMENARQCWKQLDEQVGKIWIDKIRKAVGM